MDRSWRWIPALAVLAAVSACEDPFEQFLAPVPDEPSEVALVDHRTGALQEPSAFDMLGTRPVRVDQSDGWDFLFSLPPDGPAELRPFGAVADDPNGSGVQRLGEAFEEIRRAPLEGYSGEEGVAVTEGDVLAIVSRVATQASCRRFGKIRILEVDRSGGVLRFEHLVNPNCGVRGLVPGTTGAEED